MIVFFNSYYPISGPSGDQKQHSARLKWKDRYIRIDFKVWKMSLKSYVIILNWWIRFVSFNLPIGGFELSIFVVMYGIIPRKCKVDIHIHWKRRPFKFLFYLFVYLWIQSSSQTNKGLLKKIKQKYFFTSNFQKIKKHRKNAQKKEYILL